ncbi:MAG: hypothetical protein GY820_22315 [Gammaproteobacteria bacterium]|nr:hypothetical protein [Gammaproteobacteria bacterium]
MTITFDDTAPGAVSITADGVGDGTQVQLGWASYDEVANGNDIQLYTVYRSESNFTDISQAVAIGTTAAGVKSYLATGLLRGTSYYFAVVAKDALNNINPLVTSVVVAPVDQVAPEEVGAISFESSVNQLIVNWSASVNTANDLASYKVYVDGDTGTAVPSSQTTYTITSLSAATGYDIRVTSIDNDANESTGVLATGVTLLPNPSGLTVDPYSGLVDLSWIAVTPAQYVKDYAIYVSENDFSSVSGMTPRITVPGWASISKIAGLTNGTTYYFAVTTVNSSGAEDPTVTTVSATPEQDLQGPEITLVTNNGQVLTDGATITKDANITVTATDPIGVNRIEFELDSVVFTTDANSDDGFSAYWDITATTDAPHVLTIKAYDNLENLTQIDYNLVVALAAPASPTITSPTSGALSNHASQILTGLAEKGTQIQVYLSGVAIGDLVDIDSENQFSIPVTLQEGANSFTVSAQNRGGPSAQSAAVVLNLDSSIPEPPTGMSATSEEQGTVSLNWQASVDARVAGYDLYRSTASFNEISEAAKVNTGLITTRSYDDVTAVDGTYYYRVVAVNDLGTASQPSSQVSGVADSELPKALSIEYLPGGNYDPATGRIAPGLVDVTVTMSEALLTTPFLSITPDGGIPVSIALYKASETVYTGYFNVTAETKSAVAYAVLSARDLVGNRGTGIDSGATLLFDTDGPAVTAMHLSPAAPIKTDSANPALVSVDLTIDQPVKITSSFNLSYVLSAAGRLVTPVDSIVQVDELNWRASFVLPADAGLAEIETLQFVLDTVDDLDNPGTEFNVENRFQVYQGDLPPFSAPFRLTGTALANGHVQLDWSAVAGAAEYQLYRQAPGEFELSEYTRTTAIQLIDSTLLDGDYIYTVASVRQDNGDEAISAQTTAVTVTADSTLPVEPTALSLELVGSGIKALWQPSVSSGELNYRLYRSSATIVTDVAGLTLVQDNIVANAQGELGYVDTSPSETEPTYVVTAVDGAGNESPVSVSAYLNVDLLPVATLNVTVDGANYPVISWSHTGTDISGYNIYLGESAAIQLNTSGLLSQTSFTDSGYTGGARAYTVTAVDVNAVESIGRNVVLPELSTSLSDTSNLKRDIMNQLDYQLLNGATQLSGVELQVEVAGHNHSTSSFSLDAAETKTVPVIIGGFSDLTDLSTLQTSTVITTTTDERIEIIQSQDIAVTNSNLVLDVQTQEVTRGTASKVRFTLQNTSEVETDIVTAKNGGNNESDEIRLIVTDLDGNVLSVQPILQALGDGVMTLSNLSTVARVAAAATFTSKWFDLAIPATAPDQVEISLVIDQLHYHLGAPEQVDIGGMQNVQIVNLLDVSYSATVDTVAPAASFGDQPVVISGQALDSLTSTPLANVLVKVVVSANGFERIEEVYTNDAGSYVLNYEPTISESGVLTVSVVHPDILARPSQGSFTIGRVVLTPNRLTLRLPYNYQDSIDLMTAIVGDATTATNLRLAFDAVDQTGGSLPTGITIDSSPLTLTANQSAKMPFVLLADSSAEATGSIVLKLYSDESGTTALNTVSIDYTLSEAAPALYFSPNYLETGVVYDASISEVITLDNRGFAPLNDVSLQLLNADDSAAPNWIYITSNKDVGVLDIGQQYAVNIHAAPDSSVSVAIHEFKLRVSSTNYPVTDINIYVVVTQSGTGNVIFKAADIYTATLDENNNPIPGLEGASIRIQHEDTLVIEPTKVTDELGEVMFADLPAGRYRYRASAPNHEDLIGNLTIRPGITLAEEIFVVYQLVTIEWSVTETSITDKYEITLQATYETDVPAPVVVIEPGMTNLPEMQPGDVFYGELRLTNYGLVRADNLNFSLPGEDAYFRFEFPDILPTELDAKQSFVLPYKIIALSSLNPDGTGSGGGCSSYSNSASVSHDFKCANGSTAGGSASSGWSGGSGDSSCGSSSGGGGGGGGYGGGGGGYGGGSVDGGVYLGGSSCPQECPSGSCACSGGG